MSLRDFELLNNVETVVKPWGLLRINGLHFALCCGYKPVGAREWSVLVLVRVVPTVPSLVTREWHYLCKNKVQE